MNVYTNFPLDKTIAIWIDTLYSSHMSLPPVPERIFLKLMHIATKRVQFSFDNTMNKQADGISTQSPFRAALAKSLLGFRKQNYSKSPTFHCSINGT